MSGPLQGIRILDFTWAIAGPYGSMILTDLGAEFGKLKQFFRTNNVGVLVRTYMM